MKKSDQYLKIVEWSDEDECYVGTCPSLFFGGVHGDDEKNVYADLCREVEEWVKIMKRDGDPFPPATAGKNYSGKFMLRVGEKTHKALAIRAMQSGDSLNAYCRKQLEKAV